VTEPTAPSGPTVVVAPAGPALPELVAGWLTGVDSATPNQVQTDTTAAVNAVVRRFLSVPADGEAWGSDYVVGAVMLAGRIYTRRNSPAGVATFGTEGAVYVQRNDPDVAMLLGLGPYSPLAVG
jgi:hypothetical protein